MKRALLVVVLFVAGCGDSLVTADFRGEPMISLEGRILDFSNAQVGEALRASIFWPMTDTPASDPEMLIEQTSLETRVTFPATFEINVYELPPLELLPERRFHVGVILVYADSDGDGRYSAGELRGGSTDLALVHTLTPIPREDSPTAMPLGRGFSVVRLPFACGHEWEKRGGDDCGVPLGAPCRDHDDCGLDGTCLTADDFGEYPNGYCALALDAGCRPRDGREILHLPTDSWEPIDMYGLACRTDEDCRVDDGYLCYQDYGACLPAQPLLIDIYPEFQPAPLCAEEWLGQDF